VNVTVDSSWAVAVAGSERELPERPPVAAGDPHACLAALGSGRIDARAT
jgi:hypothetical protein